MADSTTHLDSITTAQSQKEATANQLFDAMSPAGLFGRHASACTDLTWGYYGGWMLVDGVLTEIANGTLALSASSTNYIEATRAGVVSKNTTGFTAGSIPLYVIATGTSTVSSYDDQRAWVDPRYINHKVSVSITTADVTLSAAQARCRFIHLTGTLTGDRSLIVPNNGEWVVVNGTAGAYNVTVKTSAGTGEIVAQGENRSFYADGTNVVATTSGGAVATALDDLSDVDTTGVSDGDVLTYSSGSSTWGPSAAGASPVGKQTIWIPASAMTSRTTNGAATGTSESTTNKVMQSTLDFDSTTQEFAQFNIAFPKSWNESTVTAQFYWTASSGTGTVVWGLQGIALSNDDAIDTAFGTAQEVSDALIATGDVHVSSESAAITIGGTPVADDLTFFQVYRDPADASDNFSADAKLLGIKLFYTTDAVNDA
jgi:hypothetical protein